MGKHRSPAWETRPLYYHAADEGDERDEGDEGHEGYESDECDEGDEVDEGNEDWCSDVKGWSCRSVGGEDRLEEIGLLKADQCSWRRWRKRGEEQGVVHSPRTVQDQDQGEAGYQGWEANDVRQGGCCQGEASENGGQGVRRRVLEAEHLRCSVALCGGSHRISRSFWLVATARTALEPNSP